MIDNEIKTNAHLEMKKKYYSNTLPLTSTKSLNKINHQSNFPYNQQSEYLENEKPRNFNV